MSTITIRNKVAPDMDPQIESRIYFMLGSSLASVRLLEAVLESTDGPGQPEPVIRCELRARDWQGRWHLVNSQQHNLTVALEGALTRLRRSLQWQRKLAASRI
ncbi:MAG: hypothetical protein R3F41_13840 [Gammaproteobacteria bacterium]|nr:hypothetical protein [Pseudomonadales bacterium]MCP5349184.1 hypothetical protein [Pseudomonadales bacterium]